MIKRNILTIRVPEDLKDRIEKTAETQGVSLNQFALYAFTKGLADIDTSNYFKKRIKGKSSDSILKNFDKLMLKIPNKKTTNWDKL